MSGVTDVLILMRQHSPRVVAEVAAWFDPHGGIERQTYGARQASSNTWGGSKYPGCIALAGSYRYFEPSDLDELLRALVAVERLHLPTTQVVARLSEDNLFSLFEFDGVKFARVTPQSRVTTDDG